MKFEWDFAKAARNQLKHGVGFAEAVIVLEDELALTIEDASAVGERRSITIGMDAQGVLLVVIFTCRGEDIRIISARRANKSERKAYEKGIRLQ